MGDEESKPKTLQIDSTQISQIKDNQKESNKRSAELSHEKISTFTHLTVTYEILFNAFGQWLINNFKNNVDQFNHTVSSYYSSKYFHVDPRYRVLSSCIKIVNEVEKLQKLEGKKTNDLQIPPQFSHLQIKTCLQDLGKVIWMKVKQIGGNLKRTASQYNNSSHFHVHPRYQMLNFIKLVAEKISKTVEILKSQQEIREKQNKCQILRNQKNNQLELTNLQDSKQQIDLNSDDSDDSNEQIQKQNKTEIKKSQAQEKKIQIFMETNKKELLKLFAFNQDNYSTPKKEQKNDKISLFSMKKSNSVMVYDLGSTSNKQEVATTHLNFANQQQKNEEDLSLISQIKVQKEQQYFTQNKENQLEKKDKPQIYSLGNSEHKQENDEQSDSCENSQNDEIEDSHSQSEELEQNAQLQQAAALSIDLDSYNPDGNSFFHNLSTISEEQIYNYFGKWLFQTFANDVNQFAQTAQFYYTSKQYFHVGPRYHALSSCTKIVNQVQKLQKLVGKQITDPEVPQALKILAVKVHFVELGKTIWNRTKQIGANLKHTASQYNSSNYFHVGPRYQMLDFINLISKEIHKVSMIQLYQQQTEEDVLSQDHSITLSLNSENSLF